MAVKYLFKKITFTRKVGTKRLRKKYIYFLNRRVKNTADNRAKATRINKLISNFVKLKNMSGSYTDFRESKYGVRNLQSQKAKRYTAESDFNEFFNVLEDGWRDQRFLNKFEKQVSTEKNLFKEIRTFTGSNLFNKTLTINYGGKTYKLPPSAVKRLFEHYVTHLKASALGIQKNIVAADVADFENMSDEEIRAAGFTPTGKDAERLREMGKDQFITEKNQILGILNEKLTAIKNNDYAKIESSFLSFITRSGSYLLERNLAKLDIKTK